MSYGCPAFRLNGKVIAGFAAFSNHPSYLPHSGSVLGKLRKDLKGYGATKSALHQPCASDQPFMRRVDPAAVRQPSARPLPMWRARRGRPTG